MDLLQKYFFDVFELPQPLTDEREPRNPKHALKRKANSNSQDKQVPGIGWFLES
jgi:hypothetical protein